MNRQRKNNNGISPMLIGTANPKMIVATVLLIIMGILWLRVFLRGQSGPVPANAQTAREMHATPQEETKKICIQGVSLPVIPGRHDQLQIDPFVLNRTSWFSPADHQGTETNNVSNQDAIEQKHRTNLQKISQRLMLEAVVKDVNGVPIQACVNGTVLLKGSTLTIKENGETYDLTVINVSSTEIQLAWQVFTLTIKLPSSEWHD